MARRFNAPIFLLSAFWLVAPAMAKPAATEKTHRAGGEVDVHRASNAKDKHAAKSAATKPAAKTDAAKAADSDAAKPATYRVKKEDFRIDVTLDGIFEAQSMSELALRPQEWSGLSVLKAVEYGATVKRGDLLVALDCEKIDRAIADLREELKLNDVSLKQAEEQLRGLEKTSPLDMDLVRRTQKAAVEDLKWYTDVERPFSFRAADFMVKNAQDALEYEKEELRQLEKMYKADDLTEETEAIVLKRARDSVARAQFGFDRAKTEREEFLKFAMPRREEKIKETTQRAQIEWNRAKIAFPLAMHKHRLELTKLKLQRTQAQERLDKLLADRAAMTITAPCDGVVYYGRCVRGKWTGQAGEGLRRGATIQPQEVFMTVVEPRALVVRAAVPEAQLHNVRTGMKAAVEPSSSPGSKLPAIVQWVSIVPLSSGSFDAKFTLASASGSESLMPGMNCDVKVASYRKTGSTAVPLKALQTDDPDDPRPYVYLVGKQGKPEQRHVRIGRRNDKQVEILAGLHAGDQVLLERPKD